MGVFNTVRFERPETPIRTRLMEVTRSSDVPASKTKHAQHPGVGSLQTPYLYPAKRRRIAYEPYQAECNAPAIGSSRLTLNYPATQETFPRALWLLAGFVLAFGCAKAR